MKIGEKYKDDNGSKIEIVSDDYTGLNRDIVYAQFVNRRGRIITKEDLLKDKNLVCFTFAIWGFMQKKYTLIEDIKMERLELKSESKSDAYYEAEKQDEGFSFIRSYIDADDGKRVYVFVK